ncbi:helix-turn-helix transcriptional regulator [Leifsonia aquatica]|uniref:helix-turn-helix transcriptional regulator n=1 Tax=Leifsonia aquatica TaxID=144185 RepID=UPI000469D92B|nr:LuxR family transcriptional regulator [Leifsonia aquatica]
MRKQASVFVGRIEELDIAVSFIQSGNSVDVIGERTSGRSAFLVALEQRLKTAGWFVVFLRGVASLKEQPLAALYIAGVEGVDQTRGHSPLQNAVAALQALVEREKSVLLIDDWEDLDKMSWGVVQAVQLGTGLPVVRSRLRGLSARHTPSGPATSTLDSALVVEISPMRFEEIFTVVSNKLEGPAEAGMTSRIYAKSGGNIGLVVSLVETALREARIERGDDGLWTSVGEFWSPALSGQMEAYLGGVDPIERDTLETIALVGVADLDTVRLLVDWESLESLEERSLISLVSSGSRQLVTVTPPLLVEYIRHLPIAARRVRLIDAIARKLGSESPMGTLLGVEATVPRSSHENDAVFVRLLRERARARHIISGAEWDAIPSPASAVRYMNVLINDNSEPDRLGHIVLNTDIQIGEMGDRADFAITRARWQAYTRGEPAAAIADLDEQIPSAGEYAPALRAEKVSILLNDDTLDVSNEGLRCLELELPRAPAPTAVSLGVYEVRILVSLARGDFQLALTDLNEVERIDPTWTSIYSRVWGAFAHASSGNADRGLRLLHRGLDEARGLLEIEAVRAYSAGIAYILVGTGEYEATEEILDSVFAAGDPAPIPPSIKTILLSCAAVVAFHLGKMTTAQRYIHELREAGSSGGALPIQAQALALADIENLSDPQKTADSLWDAAERSRERGNRYAACYEYLTSLEIWMDPARLELAEAVVDTMEGNFFASWAAYLRASYDRNIDALLRAAQVLHDNGRYGLALDSVRYAALLATDRRDDESLKRARDLTNRLISGHSPRKISTSRFVSPKRRLSEREREVARLAAAGYSNGEISNSLVISVRTVESHLHNILKKLGLDTRKALQFLPGEL